MKVPARNILTCLCATAAMLTTSSSAEALLASVKATGMAATMTAYPMDSFVGVYNPAGMTEVEDRLDVDFAWDQTGQSATVVGNTQITPPFSTAANGFYDGGKTKDFYVSNFGIIKHLNCLPCDVTVGLVLYNRNFLKTTYGRPNLLLGTTPPGLEYLHETLSPMVAVRVFKHPTFGEHSLGASLNLNFQRFKVNGLQRFDNVLLSDHPGFVTNNGYNWSSGVGASIGWLGRFWCDRVNLGVAYQFRTRMSKFRRYRGFYAEEGTFNLPQRWNWGISWKWLPCSKIAFDVEYVDWEQIPALKNKLATNLTQQATGASSANRLGSKTGTGFGFKRQIFYRVGIDWKFGCYSYGNCRLWDCLTLRTGFRHVNIPFPRTQTGVNVFTLDVVQNFWTVGFTVDRDCFEFSGFYAHGFAKHYKGKNSIPFVLGSGEANLRQRKNALGISVGYKY